MYLCLYSLTVASITLVQEVPDTSQAEGGVDWGVNMCTLHLTNRYTEEVGVI